MIELLLLLIFIGMMMHLAIAREVNSFPEEHEQEEEDDILFNFSPEPGSENWEKENNI